MIFLDTSVLVDACSGHPRSAATLYDLVQGGEEVVISVHVLYEWLRGPRVSSDLERQEAVVPAVDAFPYDVEAAELSAQIYRSVRRARSREIDIAIAACAIRNHAQLWTLNEEDFRDIPGLRLYRPAGRVIA